MPATSTDYRDVSSLVVHADDVATALEANRTDGPQTVLRVTPPFSGRMRARLHVEQAAEYTDTDLEPFHVDPADLVEDHPYPTPDETEERLRADPDVEYSVERHHARHTEAVETWRDALAEHVVDAVELDGRHGPHRVTVAVLG